MKNTPAIRFAEKRDAPALHRLILAIAEYEKLSDQVECTVGDLERALFSGRPAAQALLAEVASEPVGYAIFFQNFSTFVGRPGLYLEDLFVLEEHRGRGIGKKLLLEVVGFARERRCGRMEWCVLDWNRPAIDFYQSLGAEVLPEWRIVRLSAPAIQKLASSG